MQQFMTLTRLYIKELNAALNGLYWRCVGIEVRQLNNPQNPIRIATAQLAVQPTYSQYPVICCAFCQGCKI